MFSTQLLVYINYGRLDSNPDPLVWEATTKHRIFVTGTGGPTFRQSLAIFELGRLPKIDIKRLPKLLASFWAIQRIHIFAKTSGVLQPFCQLCHNHSAQVPILYFSLSFPPFSGGIKNENFIISTIYSFSLFLSPLFVLSFEGHSLIYLQRQSLPPVQSLYLSPYIEPGKLGISKDKKVGGPNRYLNVIVPRWRYLQDKNRGFLLHPVYRVNSKVPT